LLERSLLTGLLTHPSGLASKEDQRQLLSLAGLTPVFSALAGVLLVTSEYRYGTIRPTILFNPARSHVLAAKVIGALAGIAFGVLGEATGWAIGYAILNERGITVVLKSAASSRSSPGFSSSTTYSSASSLRWGGSRQPALRTHSWVSESITWSRQVPARSC
jgi:hypothetical protein